MTAQHPLLSRVHSGDGVGYLGQLGGLVAAVYRARPLLCHAAPHLGRARDRVHLAGVPRARGVRGPQRAGRAVRALLRRLSVRTSVIATVTGRTQFTINSLESFNLL